MLHNQIPSSITAYVLVSHLFLFTSTKAQQNTDQLPSVLWSQYSGPWSKLRGILQSPSSWDLGSYQSYSFISAQPQNEYLIHAIDFNPRTNQVYWSDSARNVLSRQSWHDAALWTGSGITRFLQNPNLTISGIAVDWLTGNVYATEQQRGLILVTRDDVAGVGSVYSVIASGDMQLPKAICVDPYMGLLFWTDAGSQSPSIQSSSMTGGDRKVILSTSRRPVGLTVDRESRTLYWVEQATSSIYQCGYDGSNQTTLYNGEAVDSNRAISASQSHIFVVAESLLKIYVHSKSDGTLLFDLDIDAFPYDVTVPVVLPSSSTHECDTMKCEHFCLNLGSGRGVCRCAEGFYFGLDGKTCETSLPRYIYTVGSSGVLMVNATLGDSSVTLTQGQLTGDVVRAQGLDADYRRRVVHFSDTGRGSVYRINDTGGQMRELTVQQPNALGIAVHWADNTVYWTDRTLEHIMAFKPDGRYHRIVIRNLTQPMGLTLDASNGMLYWSQGDKQLGIYRANLDGSARELFYSSGSTVYQQLTLDLRTNRLYWSDPSERLLWWMNLQTRYVNKALSSNNWNNLYGVTVFSDYLTWTEGIKDLQFAGLSTNTSLTVRQTQPYLSVSHSDSFDVITYGNYLQPDISSRCGNDNGGCEQHCHSTQGKALCTCAIGFQLDDKSCRSQFNKQNVLFLIDPYHKQVYQLSPPNSTQPSTDVQGVKLPLMDFPESFEIEGQSGRIYWIDSFTRQIKSSDLSGKREKVLLDIPSGSTPRRLVVHSSTRLLYYTDLSLGSIYRMNADTGQNHEVLFSNIYLPFAIAVDQTNDMIYWSEGGTLRSGNTRGQRLNDLGQNLGNMTSFDLRSQDGLLYANDINGGKIIEFNLTSGQQRILFTSSSLQIYALTTSQDYVYFTAWNYKGIYRTRRSGSNAGQETVVDPLFARLTDLRYVELIVLPVAVLPIPIIIGAAVGALIFLLLLLLLLLLLALLYRRRKSRVEGSGSSPSNNPMDAGTLTNRTSTTLLTDSSLSPPDQHTDETYSTIMDEVTLPRALTLRSPTSGIDTLLPTNERRRPALATLVGGEDLESTRAATSVSHPPDGDSGSGEMSDNLAQGVSEATSGGNPLAAEAAFVAQKSQNYTRKPVPVNSGSHIKNIQPNPSGFELNAKGKQATFIRRMTDKLRGGISSIRFTGGRLSWSGEPSSSKPGQAHVSSALETNVESATTGNVSKAKEPQKSVPTPGIWGLFTPPRLHEPPRGHKPASPFVPPQVKTTLGRSQGKNFTSNSTEPQDV